MPLRWHLVVLSLGALLPGFLFALVLVGRVAAEERRALDRNLLGRARALSDTLDREMGTTIRVLQALAESRYLDDGADMEGFRTLAVRVHRTQPVWRGVGLFSPDGQQVLNTLRPPGEPLPPTNDSASLQATTATLKPTISNLVRARDDSELIFIVRVPVLRDGKLRFVLSAGMRAAILSELIAQGSTEEEWTRTIVDARGVVAARTRDPARFLGQPSTPRFVARISADREGVYAERTLEGTDGHVAYHRSELSGWASCIVVPSETVVGPARSTLWALLGTGSVLLVLAAAGAFLLGRRLSRAFAATAAGAEALAHGGTPELTPSSVSEVASLQGALLRSAELLRERARERDENLAQAEAARSEAEAANRVKDEFLAMLGHELRNPLAPIVTALEVLRQRGQAGSREHAVIDRQVDHLERLVDDLLDVSKITRGALTLERRPVRVGTVIERALEMAGPLLEERQHELTVEVQPEDLTIEGDPVRLAQVIANLLTNAAKYTPSRGHVRVRCRREGDEAVLAVADDGRGIPPELLSRVFEMFVQGPRRSDRSEGGLGLGLTIVKSLVAMHGGRIEAKSDGPGKGSEFTLRLPAADPAAVPPPQQETPRPGAATPVRVLVVDDNAEAAETLAELLNLEGHAARFVLDGPAALEAVAKDRPDVAILDIGLPVMDGYELATRLREQYGDGLRLLALSGYGRPQDRERSKAVGFARHFVKPVDVARLLEALRELVPARA